MDALGRCETCGCHVNATSGCPCTPTMWPHIRVRTSPTDADVLRDPRTEVDRLRGERDEARRTLAEIAAALRVVDVAGVTPRLLPGLADAALAQRDAARDAWDKVSAERDEARAERDEWKGRALWCTKHAVSQPCTLCIDEPVRAIAQEQAAAHSRAADERDKARAERDAARVEAEEARSVLSAFHRELLIAVIPGDHPEDATAVRVATSDAELAVREFLKQEPNVSALRAREALAALAWAAKAEAARNAPKTRGRTEWADLAIDAEAARRAYLAARDARIAAEAKKTKR